MEGQTGSLSSISVPTESPGGQDWLIITTHVVSAQE